MDVSNRSTTIDYQCGEIMRVLQRITGPHTAAEIRDTLAARIGSKPWMTAETIQRRIKRMAASGRVRVYERSGPQGQNCYELAREFVD